MKAIYSMPFTVLPSFCDGTARLGIPDTFAALMDIAGAHAEVIGVGIEDFFHRDIYWITIRTKVRFYERPKLMDQLTITTWTETPFSNRCHRSYQIKRGGEVLIEGKNEWTILEGATGRLIGPGELFPSWVEFPEETVLPEPFLRISNDFEGARVVGEHLVGSTDIDWAHHMNNAVYLFAMADCFSSKEWEALDIREAEIAFRSPSYEGDRLVWQRKDEDGAIFMRAQNADKTAALVKLTPGGTKQC